MADFSALYADNEPAAIFRGDSDLSPYIEKNNYSPLQISTEMESDHGTGYGKNSVTDDENEDSFFSGQASPSPIETLESLRNAVKGTEEMNRRLSSELKDLRKLLSKREMETTKLHQSSIMSMENDFMDERRLFEHERRLFLAEKSAFAIERGQLEGEIERLKYQQEHIEDEQTPEEEETDKKTLLNEIVRIKTTSAMQEEEFQRRLLAAENNVTKFKNDVVAMEMLKLAMENRIELLEDEKEFEFQKHEEQVTGLLKAAGLYDRSPLDGSNTTGRAVLTDTWVELFRRQLDDERMKINALKDCLMPFTNCLSKEDNSNLHQAGIILIPLQTAAPKLDRNSVSLFRSWSGVLRPPRKWK